MGDSISSEYQGGLSDQYVLGAYYTPYKNWVEQLVESRGLNFGPYGYHGFYRDDGYAYNQASVYNVDTDALLWQGQHTNLAAQNPTLAVLEVGANDFFFHAQEHNVNSALFGGLYDGQNPNVIVTGMLTRYQQAMETVAGTAASPTGRQMVLATVPDITRTPIVQGLSPLFYPNSLGRYRSAIRSFNNGVKALAAERNFPVLDIYGLLEDRLGPASAPLDGFSLCGNDFTLSFQSPSLPMDMFLHDGFHPNSIMHGLIAQEFIDVVNDRYGAGIEPLSDAEVIELAGLQCVPEPATLALAVAGLPWLAVLLIRRGSRTRRAAFAR